MSDILSINRGVSYDNSIVKKECHSYSPFLSNYKNNDEIRITVQHQDLYILPSESIIYVEGSLTKTDGTKSTDACLVNNAFAFLFDEIRYELNGIEIDRTRNLGIASTLKNYVSLNENESKMLLNGGWSVTETIKPEKMSFNFCVPLKILLGFAEDYGKIIANAKHELILIRSRGDDNAVIPPADEAVVNIFKLQWKVPHITAADNEKLLLLKTLESNHSIQVPFRSWDLYEYPTLHASSEHSWTVKVSNQLEKPRYIIFALQTARKDYRKKDASKFDHCNLVDLKVHLNSECYPYNDLNLKFDRERYALLYDMYAKFQQSYYRRIPQPLLSPKEFCEIAPIVIIDCSHQNEAIKTGPLEIRLEFKISAIVPPKTSAYCLLIHDRIVEYNPLTSEVKKIV